MWIIAPMVCGLIRLADRNAQPWFAGQYFRPGKTGIDLPLVGGAALFGIGWGLVGLCPGPALESLATLSPGVIVFVVAMAVGMVAHDAWQPSRRTALVRARNGRSRRSGSPCGTRASTTTPRTP